MCPSPGVFPEGNFVSEFSELVTPPLSMCGPVGAGWGTVGLLLMPALSLQADLCVMNWLLGYVDPSDPYFVAAVLTIAFNPLFWNVVSALTLTLSERAVQADGPLFLSFVFLWLA